MAETCLRHQAEIVAFHNDVPEISSPLVQDFMNYVETPSLRQMTAVFHGETSETETSTRCRLSYSRLRCRRRHRLCHLYLDGPSHDHMLNPARNHFYSSRYPKGIDLLRGSVFGYAATGLLC
jgi:hypothetical protein